VVACALAGQGTGKPLPEPGTSALGRGRPQNRVGVEPMDQGPEDCLGLAGKATAPGGPLEVADASRGHVVVGSDPARSEKSGGMSYARSGNRQGPPRTRDKTLGGGRTRIGVGVVPNGQVPQDCTGLVGKATAPGAAPPKVADATRVRVIVGSASRIPEN
jgi:hypothetical protein